MFGPQLFEMLYAGTLEKLKDKQAVKMKIDEAANMNESVQVEKNQVDNHKETSEQDETTELSQVDEVKPEESIHVEKKQVEKISALLVEKNEADDQKILEMCLNCEKSKSENVKLLNDVDSLTLEIKRLKEKEKEFENKIKASEKEDFWIKLENKNLKENETKFQDQIKVLENEKFVLEKNKFENEKAITSHFEKISEFENEAESARNKIDELEKKLKSFVTSSEFLSHLCLKPINSVPISDNVTNFDKVKIEDCDEKTDDEDEKRKIFLKLKENFQETVLQSTEKGECSSQKPLKKNAEQKQSVKNSEKVQNKNKSSSVQSSNRDKKITKIRKSKLRKSW
ncbi:hypothetical protein HanIR_Chr07g0336481 [Helianthus annuus]|nr:hypothetical protein HanIR_Chr07g0336481 [Helianthus annuus]